MNNLQSILVSELDKILPARQNNAFEHIIANAVIAYVTSVVTPLETRIAALEARITALEARG